jgi:hypothetical protein
MASPSEADKLQARSAYLSSLIDEAEKPKKGGFVSLELIAAATVPILFLVVVLIMNPVYFQRSEGPDAGSRNFSKMMYWTLGLAVVSAVAFGGWYWYKGGKLMVLC